MKAVHRALTVAVVTFTLAKAASAATLHTPFMWSQGTDVLYCSAVNVSPTPLASITVELIDQTGTTIATSSCPSLAPNGYCGVTSTPAATAHCKITLTGSKPRVRAFIEVDDTGGNTKAGMPAS